MVGYRIARHGIRPVEEIAATARTITSTNLRERIRAEGYPSELAALAGTFNEMLDRLEQSFEQISRSQPISRMTCGRRSTIFVAKPRWLWHGRGPSMNTAMCWSLHWKRRCVFPI